MTHEKSDAERLAHWLERDGANCQQHIDCAAELRRIAAVERQRDQLLEALKMLLKYAKACEGVLNCKPAGQIGISESAVASVEAEIAKEQS